MSIRVSTRFYLHPHELANGAHKVYCRITVLRKKAEFSTGLEAFAREWDNSKGLYSNKKARNEELVQYQAKIIQAKNFLELEGKEVSAKAIRDVVTERKKLRLTLLEFTRKFIEQHEKLEDLSKSALDKYKTTEKYLKSYIEHVLGQNDIALKEVDFAFVDGWDGFLKGTNSKQFGRRLSGVTIEKYHVRLKTILIKAQNEDYLLKNPYGIFKIKKVKVPPKYLSADELKKIREQDLGSNESLEKVRDIFLFTCYTGLRFTDAQSLQESDIYKDGSGSFIEKTQEKTKNDVYIPLLPEAQNILSRWEHLPERQITAKLYRKFLM